LIVNTLEQVAKDGVSESQIESVLHQLELSQREVGGDGYPYGLQIILSAISACTHYSDPVELLDLDPALEKLREKSKQPDFVANLIDKYLLSNSHRVTLTFKPDQKLDQNKVEAEQAKLERIKNSLTDEQIKEIVSQGETLKARQLAKDDDSILPKVGISDVADKLTTAHPSQKVKEKIEVTAYEQGTNGLTYHQVITELPKLNEEELTLLPLALNYMTEVGLADQDYLEVQERQSLVVGGISAYSSIKSKLDNQEDLSAYWVLSGKALSRNRSDFLSLMSDTYQSPNYSDEKRITDLLAQSLNRKEQSISGNGHGLAMNIASSGIHPVANLAYKTSGLPSLLRMRELVKSADKSIISDKLSSLHEKLIKEPSQHLLISDPANSKEDLELLTNKWESSSNDKSSNYGLDFTPEIVSEAWVVPTQSNFCAKVYPTVTSSHSDAPALTVLGVFLRNGFLHTAIREQGGAYGGGASQDNAIGAFKFYSYRDPRVAGTMQDFDKAIEWFKSEKHDDESLEQSILGVISSIDKPSSPAGEAKLAFHNDLQGKTEEWRNKFRQNILSVTYDDLNRVINTYFDPKKASIAAVISSQSADEAKSLGMTIKEI